MKKNHSWLSAGSRLYVECFHFFEQESTLQGSGLHALNGGALDEVCRLAPLLRAIECLPAEQHAPFINVVYLRGDNYERQALLRALTFLSDPERFVATAVGPICCGISVT